MIKLKVEPTGRLSPSTDLASNSEFNEDITMVDPFRKCTEVSRQPLPAVRGL